VMNYTIIDMEDKITQIFKPAYKWLFSTTYSHPSIIRVISYKYLC
jgi:hypothetical protein